jgi:DNA-binding NtrC family response regulator
MIRKVLRSSKENGMEDFKVLIAEDDEMARNKLAREIKKEGFSVLTAENGRIAFELFVEENPPIVVTDLKMPEMSGLELLIRVKQILPKAQVILLSAYGDMDTVIQALREGALDYIKKPIELDLLTRALRQARRNVLEYEK